MRDSPRYSRHEALVAASSSITLRCNQFSREAGWRPVKFASNCAECPCGCDDYGVMSISSTQARIGPPRTPRRGLTADVSTTTRNGAMWKSLIYEAANQ
jgi:hypothetical protein